MDIHAPRLNVSPRLREMMAYPKFRDTPRLLVLENEYWLDSACVRAATALGWEVQSVPVRMEGAMPRELVAGFLGALTEFRPDFILSINLSGMDTQGLFAGLFQDLAVPYATWFVDDPRTILMGSRAYASDCAVAFTWEAAYGEYLRGCGFSAAHVLPLGVDDSLFNAAPSELEEDCLLPPSFVGNSMEAFAAREWAWVRARPALCERVEAAFAGGRVNRETFAVGMGAVLGTLEGLSTDDVRHAEILCFVEGSRRLRHDLALTVIPHGAIMHGDSDWGAVTEQCAGPVHYFEQLPAHYRATPVNLNTTSVQMASAVNQRVFDCPAAGGFLLTDAQSSLADLFDVEREVAVYHDLQECAELLQQYLAAPALRREMSRRARARILGEHTYRDRLRSMRDCLAGQFRA